MFIIHNTTQKEKAFKQVIFQDATGPVLYAASCAGTTH